MDAMNIFPENIVVSNLFLIFASDKLAHNGLAGRTYWTDWPSLTTDKADERRFRRYLLCVNLVNLQNPEGNRN